MLGDDLDTGSAGGFSSQQGTKADGAVPHDSHRIPGLNMSLPHGVESNSERFNKSAEFIGDGVRQLIAGVVRNNEVLRHAAIAEKAGEALVQAEVIAAHLADVALTAIGVAHAADPVPNLEAPDAFAHLRHR